MVKFVLLVKCASLLPTSKTGLLNYIWQPLPHFTNNTEFTIKCPTVLYNFKKF